MLSPPGRASGALQNAACRSSVTHSSKPTAMLARYISPMQATGTFEIQMAGEPPFSEEDGVVLARATFTKQFSGDLAGDSIVYFLSARTPVPNSAGYVALERVVGTLAGRRGTFILQHAGQMAAGTQTLTVTVVPDSATGELRGLAGSLRIDIIEKKHHYTFDYTLGA